MKKSILTLFVLLCLMACGEEEVIVFDVDNGQTLLAFNGSSSVDLPVTADGNSSITLEVGVTTRSDTERTYSVTVDPASTASIAEYTTGSSISIPAGAFVGSLEVIGNFDAVPDGVTNTLILNLEESSGAILGGNNQVTINIFRFCPSELAVEFNWVASGFVYQGSPLGDGGFPSGTDAFIDDDGDGIYDIASGFWDFGYYCVWYFGSSPGCGGGASGNLQLKEVCGKLSFVGTDQYGDPWSIFNVSTSGPVLNFTFLSAFGEQADVELTRTDGMDWPFLSD